MKYKLSMAAAAAALLAGAPSWAQNVVDLTGEVAEQCSATPVDKDINFGTLGNNGAASQKVFTANLYCNKKFDATVSTQNGRLLHNDSLIVEAETTGNGYVDDPSGVFQAALDYSLEIPAFSFDEDSSDPTYIAGAVYSGDDLPPTATGNIQLIFDTVDLPSGEFLVAGTYSDKITLTITPDGL